MSSSLIRLAVLPAVVLVWYIWRKDTVEKEPPALLAKLFGLGVLVTIPVIVVELAAEAMLGKFLVEGSLPYVFLENFYGIALVEEAGKYLVLKSQTWKSEHFNYMFDGVVYAVLVALGFATLENIFYVADGGVSTGIARALLSVPGHAIDGVCMGYFYGLAKRADLKGNANARGTNLVLALVAPTLLHGTYDFLISIKLIGVFLIFEVIVTVLAIIHVNKFSREDAPL